MIRQDPRRLDWAEAPLPERLIGESLYQLAMWDYYEEQKGTYHVVEIQADMPNAPAEYSDDFEVEKETFR